MAVEAARRIPVAQWHALQHGQHVYFSASKARLDAVRTGTFHELGAAQFKIGERTVSGTLVHENAKAILASELEGENALIRVDLSAALAIIQADGGSITEGVAVQLAGGE